ncbi:hypothetical protein KIPB_004937, partial [Kipferlia bialata]|eukprot:g4937.t1
MGIRGFYGALKRAGLVKPTPLSSFKHSHLLVDTANLKFTLSECMVKQGMAPKDIATYLTAFLSHFGTVTVVADGAMGATEEQMRKRASRFSNRCQSVRAAAEWLLYGTTLGNNRFLCRAVDDASRAVFNALAGQTITAPAEADDVIMQMALDDPSAVILTGDSDMCKVPATLLWTDSLGSALCSLRDQTYSASVSTTDCKESGVMALLTSFHESRVGYIPEQTQPEYRHCVSLQTLPPSFMDLFRQGTLSNLVQFRLSSSSGGSDTIEALRAEIIKKDSEIR